MKFEEAYVDLIDEEITIEDVANIYKRDFLQFQRLQEHLYCPECRTAQLAFVSSKVCYFRSFPNSEHIEDCSFRQSMMNKKETKEFVSLPQNIDVLKRQLKNLILRLHTSKVTSPKRHNINSASNRRVEKNNLIVTLQKKTMCFPQKRIDLPLKEDDYDIIKFFYGKVYCKWETDKEGEGYKLLVYTALHERLRCRIHITGKVYKYLPDEFKFVGKRLCNLAFVAELKEEPSKTYCKTNLIHSGLFELYVVNNEG